jgi:hypothetical protein
MKHHSLTEWTLVASLCLMLGLGVTACGGKQSMEAAGQDDQVGAVNDKVTRLAGEEDGIAQADFDKAERDRRLAHLPRGSTKSGPGKKNGVVVKAGDTLWKIAERKDVYGSGWLYPLIYKANQSLIKDPNKLEAGVKLSIPRDVSAVQEEMAKEDAMTGQVLDTSPLPGTKPTPTVNAYVAKPMKKSGHSALWFLLLVLTAALGLLWARMKKRPAEGAAA